ncbi:MAG: lipopolysaccharide biosynthesis protein [Hyphomicrobiales bacterium]|nr:lipopolysaccharide biosynthesis protein [Hyphomicrobiales bacterium]
MGQVLDLLPQPLKSALRALLFDGGEEARSRRGALMAFSIRVASAAIAFVSQVLLARWIGGYDFGIFTYVWVWLNILGTLCTLGFAISAVRFLPEYRATAADDLARGFLHAGRRVSFGAGLVCTLAGLAVLYLLDEAVADYYRVPMALALVCLPAYALMDFQDGVGRAHSWIDLGLAPPYIARPLLLLAFLALAISLGWSRSAETAVIAGIAANWVAVAGQYALQERRLDAVLPRGARGYRLDQWLKVSMPALLLEGFALLMINLDILLLDIFVAPGEIATYYAAARTISLVGFVHFAVTAAWMPRFSAAHARGEGAAVEALFAAARKWTFVPSLAGGVALLALGRPILWLFGPEFTVGYPVMFVLVLGLLARAAAGPAQGLLVVTGKHNMTAIVMAVTVCLNAALNLYLIPRFGLIGAAAATSAAFGYESLTLYAVARRTIREAPAALPAG